VAEESGILVIKGPEALLKKFIGAENSDTTELLSELAEVTGMQRKHLDREDYVFYSAEMKAGYLKLEYDCSEWSFISVSIVHTAKDIELYSRVSNEYGVKRYFALTNKGKKFVYSIDPESGQLDKKKGAEEAVHQLKEWLDRIPEDVNNNFPSLSNIDIDSIVPPKLLKKKKLKINLKCKFDSSITEDDINEALQNKFNDYELTIYKNSEHSGGSHCGYWDKCRIQTMNLKPEYFESYKIGFWFPITRGKKTANDLLGLLIAAGIPPRYAIEFYGESSNPYKIHYIDGENLQTIFDSSLYSELELEALCNDAASDLDMKINWFSLEFEQIRYLDENFGLKKYVDERLKVLSESQLS
jgi:hypothetical protein